MTKLKRWNSDLLREKYLVIWTLKRLTKSFIDVSDKIGTVQKRIDKTNGENVNKNLIMSLACQLVKILDS